MKELYPWIDLYNPYLVCAEQHYHTDQIVNAPTAPHFARIWKGPSSDMAYRIMYMFKHVLALVYRTVLLWGIINSAGGLIYFK